MPRPSHTNLVALFLFSVYRQLNWLFAFLFCNLVICRAVQYAMWYDRYRLCVYVLESRSSQSHFMKQNKTNNVYQCSFPSHFFRCHSFRTSRCFGLFLYLFIYLSLRSLLHHQIYNEIARRLLAAILVLVMNKENDATSSATVLVARFMRKNAQHCIHVSRAWNCYRSIRPSNRKHYIDVAMCVVYVRS